MKTQDIATNILVEAYKSSSNVTWVLPESLKKRQVFFASIVKDAEAKNGIHLTNNKQGVLLLYSLTANNASLAALLRKLRVLFNVTGLKKGLQLLSLEKTKIQIRPKHGLYGIALAISNNQHAWQTRLELKSMFEKIQEKTKLPVYVETTNERIKKLYENLGFKTYHMLDHPYANLTIWFMELK
jgi:hypothetical protein